jgi:hypothetical protein
MTPPPTLQDLTVVASHLRDTARLTWAQTHQPVATLAASCERVAAFLQAMVEKERGDG